MPADVACLTWNTCRCLNKLSVEVGNDSVTLFGRLHPKRHTDRKYC